MSCLDMTAICCNGWDGNSPCYPPAGMGFHAKGCPSLREQVRSIAGGNRSAAAELDWGTNVGLSEPGREPAREPAE